jgi:hypothetical protein
MVESRNCSLIVVILFTFEFCDSLIFSSFLLAIADGAADVVFLLSATLLAAVGGFLLVVSETWNF